MSVSMKKVTMYQLDIPGNGRRWFETPEKAVDFAENHFNHVFKRAVLEQMPENTRLTGVQAFELLKMIHACRGTLVAFLQIEGDEE